MKNFFNETRYFTDDKIVTFIGVPGEYELTWQKFANMADFEYDDGYGWPEIRCDLVIIFSDGTWLTRGEYDGSEWWEPHELPEAGSNLPKLPSLLEEN